MALSFTYDLATPLGQVRLLLNDVDADSAVFTDSELYSLLEMEGGAVKLAAAQAIDTNADNQALALKVLRNEKVSTDGAALAGALYRRAERLRDQHYQTAAVEDEGFFEIVPGSTPQRVELGLTTYWP